MRSWTPRRAATTLRDRMLTNGRQASELSRDQTPQIMPTSFPNQLTPSAERENGRERVSSSRLRIEESDLHGKEGRGESLVLLACMYGRLKCLYWALFSW